ncbi:MAG: metal ABC transporter ATP-binding protein [Candidatus Tectimicrobiota bacterium]
MHTADLLVQAVDLALGYAQHSVLHDVQFTLRAGEFWFCLGLNGAGKSTLLRAVLGLLRPQTGTLWRHPQLADFQRVGFVPQQCGLNPALDTTVREFVSLGTVGTRQSRRAQAHNRQWALECVGLDALAHHAYWSLSGGQQQRALVARALVRRPQLLVLDEPTSGFDPPTTAALLQTLATLNREAGMALFCVTHDLPLALRYATHLALLGQGQVSAGPARVMLTQPTLTQVYGRPMTITYAADGSPTLHMHEPGAGPC